MKQIKKFNTMESLKEYVQMELQKTEDDDIDIDIDIDIDREFEEEEVKEKQLRQQYLLSEEELNSLEELINVSMLLVSGYS